MHKAVRLNAVTYPVEPDERTDLERCGAAMVAIEGQQPDDIVAAAADCDALLIVSSYVPGAVIEKEPVSRRNRCHSGLLPSAGPQPISECRVLPQSHALALPLTNRRGTAPGRRRAVARSPA